MNLKINNNLKTGLLVTLMIALIVIGAYAQSSKEKSYEELLKSYTLENADVVNSRDKDFMCPNVYDLPYAYITVELKLITTTCQFEGSLSYDEASASGNFSIGKKYRGTYERKYCKDAGDRKVCCEVAEQGARLLDIEEI